MPYCASMVFVNFVDNKENAADLFQPAAFPFCFLLLSPQKNPRQPVPARGAGEPKRPAQDCRLRVPVPVIAGAAADPPPAL